MSDLFYLQDSRSVCGNDLFFWAADGRGYTTDVNKAQVYSREDAMAQHEARNTDIPWPKAYIDSRTRPTVDFQYCNRKEALSGTGIKIIEPTKMRRQIQRCESCGIFLSDVQRYCSKCPKCGSDNRP